MRWRRAPHPSPVDVHPRDLRRGDVIECPHDGRPERVVWVRCSTQSTVIRTSRHDHTRLVGHEPITILERTPT